MGDFMMMSRMNVAKVLHRIVDLPGSGLLGVDLSVYSNRGQEGMKSLGEIYANVIEFRVDKHPGGTRSNMDLKFVDQYERRRDVWLSDVYQQKVFILVGAGESPAVMFFVDERRFALYPELASVESGVLDECGTLADELRASDWEKFLADFKWGGRRMFDLPSDSARLHWNQSCYINQFDLTNKKCVITVTLGGSMQYVLSFCNALAWD